MMPLIQRDHDAKGWEAHKKKNSFFHQSVDLYGSSRTLIQLCEHLLSQDWECGVVLPSSGDLGRHLEKKGAAVFPGETQSFGWKHYALDPQTAAMKSGTWAWRNKRAMDVTLTLLGLPFVLPMMGIAAAALFFTAGKDKNGKRDPIHCKQWRPGYPRVYSKQKFI